MSEIIKIHENYFFSRGIFKSSHFVFIRLYALQAKSRIQSRDDMICTMLRLQKTESHRTFRCLGWTDSNHIVNLRIVEEK